jgi:AcrR family transcriptional regulator
VLVERAAQLLAAREPVTLRSLVAGTGASTMAVYTYFGGMPGLWRAVRQEGFTRLASRLSRLPQTADAVHDLAALGAVYQANALDSLALYRTMFDATYELEDPAAADAAFQTLVDAAARATATGRFSAGTDPVAAATRYWALGHGLASLVIGGVLPEAELRGHATAMSEALFIACGDDPARCRRSIDAGWRSGSQL